MISGSPAKFLDKLAWIDEHPVSWLGIVCGALAFVVPLVLYLKTGMREPSGSGDYAKFAFIGTVWGIPNSNGFPLYLIFDGIVSHIPLGGLTFRVMAISATSMALMLHFVYRVGRTMKFPPLLALGAALLAATGRSVWFEGIIVKSYGVYELLVMAAIWAVFHWYNEDDDRWMWAGIWFLILAAAAHPCAVFAFPGLFLFALVYKPRVFLKAKTWLHAIGAVLTTAALYGYIFWRSFAPPTYNECLINGNFKNFLNYLAARDYSWRWGVKENLAAQRWALFVQLGIKGLGRLGWLTMWPGIIAIGVRNRLAAIPVVLVLAGTLGGALKYHTNDAESWISLTFPFCALLIASLAMWAIELVSRPGKAQGLTDRGMPSVLVNLLVAAVTVFMALGIIAHLKTNIVELDRSGPSKQHAQAERVVQSVRTPALIIPPSYTEVMDDCYCLYTDPRFKVKEFVLTWVNSPTVPIALVDGYNWNVQSVRDAMARRIACLHLLRDGRPGQARFQSEAC